jgi:hypothetical protein
MHQQHHHTNSTMARKKKVSAVNPSSTTNQSDSKLLNLTPELRNKIFKLVLMNTKLSWNRRRCFPKSAFTALQLKNDGKPNPPALVVVCKQLHSETIQVLYHEARFNFERLPVLRIWLLRFSVDHLKLVKRVSWAGGIKIPQEALQKIKAGED